MLTNRQGSAPQRCAILVVGLLTLIVGCASSPPGGVGSRTTSDAEHSQGANVEGPIGGGRVVDLATAQAEMPFGLLMPDSDEARTSTLVEVWSEPTEHEVGLVFDHEGARVTLDLYPAYLADPKANYQAEIDLHLADQSLTQVLGQPAVITEPFTDVPKTNPAWLQFDLQGVDVNLFSFEYSTADLIRIAETLRPLANRS